MAINTGYLKSKRDKKSDETYTPFYAVDPLIEFIPKGSVVWCPFDKAWSAFVQVLVRNGIGVIHTHIDYGKDKDFFTYEPNIHYDYIISNPPFSIKDKVLERLEEIGKPYAMLLPINSLQGKKRFRYVKDIELLFFDERIGFHNIESMDKTIEGSPFACGYFCKGLLPKKLIGKELKKYDEKLL